jgi:hypothetical protein
MIDLSINIYKGLCTETNEVTSAAIKSVSEFSEALWVPGKSKEEGERIILQFFWNGDGGKYLYTKSVIRW